MFDRPRAESHDGWVAAARRAVGRVTARKVGDAFLASLTSRRLDLRSALGSYALARHLPEHAYDRPSRPGLGGCAVCGLYVETDGSVEPEDLNVLSFERFRWGGVRHDWVIYAAFDLEQFARAPGLPVTVADIEAGRQIISVLRQAPPGTTAAQAARLLRMVGGNQAERDEIVEILGLCGILSTREHPGYCNSFVPLVDRDVPMRRFVFGCYPVCWWTAADGVNDAALEAFLPDLA
jgi:hypothetical protein